jgi:polyferredoxin
MIKIKKNKYLSALKNLILFSASIHILLLIIYSVIKLDITHLNYFNILDFDLFFPNIIHGSFSQILSIIVISVIYFIIYFISLKKNK